MFIKPIVLSNQLHMKPMGLLNGIKRPLLVPNNVKPLIIPNNVRKPVALTNRNTTPQPIVFRAPLKRRPNNANQNNNNNFSTRKPNGQRRRTTTKAPGVHRVNKPKIAMVFNLGGNNRNRNRNRKRPVVVVPNRRNQNKNRNKGSSTTKAPAVVVEENNAAFKTGDPVDATPWPSLEIPTPISKTK